jgi:two-component system alkaline phosphatase synthesis response regulator PhoP
VTAPPRSIRPLVVVADDESHILQLLTMVLEDLGAEVIAVRNGELALHAVRERRPALLLTDVMMPRLRGDHLCRRIKDDPTLAGTPVVVLSAVSQEDVRDFCADEYVAKPFDLDQIEALYHRFTQRAVGNRLPDQDSNLEPTG